MFSATGLLFKTDGTVELVQYHNDLYQLYELLQCKHVEYYELVNNYILWVDDTAALTDSKYNVFASQLLTYQGLHPSGGPCTIWGNALLLRKDGDDNYIDVDINLLKITLDLDNIDSS